MKYTIKGIVEYFDIYIVAWLERDLAEYYRSLIPKYYNVQGTRYKPHLTIVRLDLETPDKKLWYNHNSEIILIHYVPEIKTDGLYWWLDAYSKDVEKIRKEVGLPKYRDGFDRYHITIGNNKDVV